MSTLGDRVDAWEIRRRDDGTFAVYDLHGMLAGPFGTKEAAMVAALHLPKPAAVPSNGSRGRTIENGDGQKAPR